MHFSPVLYRHTICAWTWHSHMRNTLLTGSLTQVSDVRQNMRMSLSSRKNWNWNIYKHTRKKQSKQKLWTKQTKDIFKIVCWIGTFARLREFTHIHNYCLISNRRKHRGVVVLCHRILYKQHSGKINICTFVSHLSEIITLQSTCLQLKTLSSSTAH